MSQHARHCRASWFCSKGENAVYKKLRKSLLIMTILCAALTVFTSAVNAQTYTKMLVLLPGEVAAPGTPSGKTGTPAAQTVNVPLIVHPGLYARVQLVVPGQDPLPGSITGVVGAPATQAAVVASADEVLITSTDPAGSTPVAGKMNTGYTQVSLSLGTVGAQTLTITNTTAGTIMGMTTDPIQVIAAAADHFEIDAIASSQTAGVPVEVTIRATDVNSNTIPDYFGDAILAANTGPGSISLQAITFTNGVWTGDMIFKGAGGAVTFSCSDYSSPPHTGTSNSFQVLPGPFVGLQVLLPGQTAMGGTETGYTGEPTSHNAVSGFTMNVRAVDEFWNRVPTINDRIALGSTDEFASMPAETTLSNGEITIPVILYKGGFQTITAADVDSTEKAPHTPRPVEILSGPYAKILLLVPVVYELIEGDAWIRVTSSDGRSTTITGDRLDANHSRALFDRTGTITRIEVGVPEGRLFSLRTGR